PMKMLFLSPIVFLMSLYVAVNYGIMYLLFIIITFVFEERYHFSTGSVGLSYLGAGIGMIVGMGALGVISDKIIRKQIAKGNVKPEHRLPLLLTMPGALGLPIGLFVYGWTAQYRVHWITYLVDALTLHAASAIAANTVLRSIFGAVLPLCGLSMYDKLGLGWGDSLLGFVGLALIPVPVFFRFYGERVRTRFRVSF
ncbi:MFS general substrate transporter, partial [Polyplosphaeria fusca]